MARTKQTKPITKTTSPTETEPNVTEDTKEISVNSVESTLVTEELLEIPTTSEETNMYLNLDLSSMSEGKIRYIKALIPQFPNITLSDVETSRFKYALKNLLKI
jgi:hypothetical protein